LAGVYGKINSRADFAIALHRAIADGRVLQAKYLKDGTIGAILRQLECGQRWTANGRTPTDGERASIDIATRAAREFEGDDETYQWSRSLYSLDAYIADWPSDDEASTATDDDFWDSED
jgi:hypothetical protein